MKPLLIIIIVILVILAVILFGIYWTYLFALKKIALKQINLNEKTQYITALKENSDLCVQVCKDIVQLLGVDYSVVSVVDFNQNILKSIAMYVQDNQFMDVQHPEKWIGLSKYSTRTKENEKIDILIKVLEKKERSLVIGKNIFEKDEVVLNKIIFDNFEHSKLARLYIPVIHFNRTELKNQISEPIFENGKIKYIIPKNENRSTNERKINKENSDSVVLGVIELGIKNIGIDIVSNNFGKNLSSKYLSAIFLLRTGITLKLARVVAETYADRFAEIYYENYLNEQKRILTELLKPHKNILTFTEKIVNKYNNHDAYAYNILKEISEWVKSDFAIISYKTFNNNFVSYSEDCIHYNISSDKIKKLSQELAENGITEEVCRTGNYYYSNDVKNDKNYVEAIENVNSELVFPLKRGEEIIGVLSLCSYSKDAFEPITFPIIEYAVKELVNQYIRKKRYTVYLKLTDPERPWNGYDEIYESIANQLKDYFNCRNVVTWHKNENDINGKFDLVYSTNSTLKAKLATLEIDPPKLGSLFSDGTISISFEENIYKNNLSLSKYLKEEKFKFLFIIKITNDINYDDYYILFSRLDIFEYPINKLKKNSVNAYMIKDIIEQRDIDESEKIKISKVEIAKNFINKDFDFLEQIIRKARISIQNIKLLKSIKLINNTLLFSQDSAKLMIEDSESKNSILKKIVNAALEATDCDIVTLYIYTEAGSQILKKDAITAANINNRNFEDDKVGRALLANIIINDISNQTVFIFTEEEEYFQYIYNSNTEYVSPDYKSKSFRTLNGINTSVAIKLTYYSTPIGVMFFNYVKKVNINKNSDLLKLIVDFSNVAAVQVFILIKLQASLEELRTERAKLKSDNDYLEQQREELKVDLIKSNDLLQELIPAATRTSFYLILHAVNHDVGNILQALVNTMDALTSKSMLSESGKKVFFPYKEKILNTIDVLHNLLDLFDFSDEQPGIKQKIKNVYDINNIIKQLVTFFRDIEPQIEFHINLGKIPLFNCNRMEISMVIYNLINNAVYFIKQAEKKHGLIVISTLIKNRHIEIIIVDNGTGIDSNIIDKIFEPRFTTKPPGQGLGIGLYFVQQILEGTYHGSVTVSSAVNKNTTFTLRIPEYFIHTN